MKKLLTVLLLILGLCSEAVFGQIPTVPTLATPSNGSVNMGVLPVFNWNPSAGAMHRFQISLSPNFNTLLLDSGNQPTGQFYIPPGVLQTANTYYWRVNATNSFGSSAFSAPFYFSTTGALPIASALYLPANGAIGQSLTPTLTWQSQLNIVKYHIQVSTASDFSVITDSASVTTAQRTIPAGRLIIGATYYWRVKATNFVGTGAYSAVYNFSTSITGVNTVNAEVPKVFKLYGNYPNPFNPATTIRLSVPKSEHVTLKIYNTAGKLVSELLSNYFNPGTYEIQWNAENFSSGVYYYSLESPSFKDTKRMILVK
ncbi:MAG: T9SS type A sorting domain-containing protein [Ignavibacteria bacterium]|nr:T9SS type A sorting domain-containing protein [Ignavibacteria bacterium]